MDDMNAKLDAEEKAVEEKEDAKEEDAEGRRAAEKDRSTGR